MSLLIGTDGGSPGATALVVVPVGGGAPKPYVWHWRDVDGLIAAERALREALARLPESLPSWHGEQPFGLAAAPKAGVRQGQAIGWWQHVAVTLGLELVLVAPAVWRRAWGVPHGPGSTSAAARHSRALVRMLWPDLDAGSADHGCDAVLLATHADAEVLAWAAEGLRRLAVVQGSEEARRLLVTLACGGERVRRRGRPGRGGARVTTATTTATAGGAAPTTDARPGRGAAWTDELVAAHLARLGR